MRKLQRHRSTWALVCKLHAEFSTLLACCALIGSLAVSFFVPGIAHAQSPAIFTPHRNDPFKMLRLDGNFVRWHPEQTAAAQDSDVVLTYRILSQSEAFDGARNCRRMTGLAQLQDRSHLDDSRFREEVRSAFAMWEGVARIRFREVPENETANITIGAQADPEGWAFADVFYEAAAPQPIKPISRALVCLNPQRMWKIGFDGDLKVYDIRYTLTHEIGHAIGLDHPNGSGQMMGYRYEEQFRELQEGDIHGVVAIYGARHPAKPAIETSSIAPTPVVSAAPAPTPGNSESADVPTTHALKPSAQPDRATPHPDK